MIHVEPFQEIDLTYLDMRGHEKETVDVEQLRTCALNNACVTLLNHANTPIAITGFYYVNPGVIYIFFIPSVAVPRHIKSILKVMLGYQKRLEQDLPIHRMMSYSLADDQTDRWMKALGFECEGTMRKYTKDRLDYRIWARMV